jgi:X-linked retinitis pigmentosa GTPase regulator
MLKKKPRLEKEKVIYRSTSAGPDRDDKDLEPYLDGEWSKETDWGEPGPSGKFWRRGPEETPPPSPSKEKTDWDEAGPSGKFWRRGSEETPSPSPSKEKTEEDVWFTDRDTTDSEFESAVEKGILEKAKQKPEESLFTDEESEPEEEEKEEDSQEESESQSETSPPRTRYKRKTQPRDELGRFLSRKEQTGQGEDGDEEEEDTGEEGEGTGEEGEGSGEEGEGSGEEGGGEEEVLYAVEKIIDTVVRGCKIYHLVKWEGHDERHNSWIEASRLECP